MAKKERKRIEDIYTFQVNNFGRIILSNDRKSFDCDADRFRLIVEKYQTALKIELTKLKSEFETRLIDEYTPRWHQSPPGFFARYGTEATPQNIRTELKRRASELFTSAVAFDPPVVKIIYKNISWENIQDPAFLEALKTSMNKKNVPTVIINSLFEVAQAAPETGRFLGR